MTNTLKPCLFCGGDKLTLHVSTSNPNCYLVCKCGSSINAVVFKGDLGRFEYMDECMKVLADLWNRRHTHDFEKENLGRMGALNPHKVLAELLERYGNLKDEKETQSTDRGKRLIEAEAKGVKDSIQIARRILLNEEEEC